MRADFWENAKTTSSDKASKKPLTRAEFDEFSTLLENSFTFGSLSDPHKSGPAPKSNSSGTTPPAWNGTFFVYDRTGKEALLSKAVLRLRSSDEEVPQVSKVTIGGVEALKIERKSGVTYWVENGKYAVSANERSVLEEILARLAGKSTSQDSLGQSPAFREALPTFDGGLLQFFIRIPDLKQLAGDANASGIPAAKLIDAAKLSAVHSICGHITLDGAKTRFQFAILGDASADTPFDIWSDGQAVPPSLAFVPASAVYYNSTQLNLLGIYTTIKRISRAVLPPAQQGGADMLEMLAQAKLGMTLQDALSALTGEFASIQTSPSLDPDSLIFFLGVNKKPETLKLIHILFTDHVAAEQNEGDVTLLKISSVSGPAAATASPDHFNHLVITSGAIFGAGRAESVHEFFAKHGKAPTSDPLAALASFRTARAQFPEKVTGLSYADFQKIDWPAAKARWVADQAKAAAASSSTAKSAQEKKTIDWLARANPQVFPRHLHSSFGASWKDDKGIHFDQWIQ